MDSVEQVQTLEQVQQQDPTVKFNRGADFTFRPDVEGGFTVDNGGPTNYGVTQETLDNFNAKNGYPKMNVKDLTPDDARFVGRKVYFDEPGYGVLPDRVAAAAFDYGFNSGNHQAVKDLQRVVGATPDGRMGPKTVKQIEAYVAANGEDALLDGYIGRRQELMKGLVAKNPMKYAKYAVGWANRLVNLRKYLAVQASSGAQ